jgi:hypothetical protein
MINREVCKSSYNQIHPIRARPDTCKLRKLGGGGTNAADASVILDDEE